MKSPTCGAVAFVWGGHEAGTLTDVLRSKASTQLHARQIERVVNPVRDHVLNPVVITGWETMWTLRVQLMEWVG